LTFDAMRLPPKKEKPALIFLNTFKVVSIIATALTALFLFSLIAGGIALASYKIGGWAGVIFITLAAFGVFFLYQMDT